MAFQGFLMQSDFGIMNNTLTEKYILLDWEGLLPHKEVMLTQFEAHELNQGYMLNNTTLRYVRVGNKTIKDLTKHIVSDNIKELELRKNI